MPSQTTGDADAQGGPSRELLEALGWLTVRYSGLETQIAAGIWRMVDERGFKGGAITAGRRLLDLADLYVALAKMEAPQAATEFAELRSGLKSVNDRRNRFVHSAWSVRSDMKGKDFRFGFRVRGGKGFKHRIELTDPAEVRTVGDDALSLTEKIAEITERCIGSGQQSSD